MYGQLRLLSVCTCNSYCTTTTPTCSLYDMKYATTTTTTTTLTWYEVHYYNPYYTSSTSEAYVLLHLHLLLPSIQEGLCIKCINLLRTLMVLAYPRVIPFFYLRSISAEVYLWLFVTITCFFTRCAEQASLVYTPLYILVRIYMGCYLYIYIY